MAEKSRLNVVYGFFGKAPVNDFRVTPGTLSTFRDEWKDLTEKDRDELGDGIANGSLTY